MRRPARVFDPYAILAALDQERTIYILIGAFARVIEGSDEITLGVDLTPSTRPENLRRLDLALAVINPQKAQTAARRSSSGLTPRGNRWSNWRPTTAR